MDFIRSHFGKMHLCPVEPFFLHFDSRSALIWNQSEEKRVQLDRGASFRSDFLQNPYFSFCSDCFSLCSFSRKIRSVKRQKIQIQIENSINSLLKSIYYVRYTFTFVIETTRNRSWVKPSLGSFIVGSQRCFGMFKIIRLGLWLVLELREQFEMTNGICKKFEILGLRLLIFLTEFFPSQTA